MLVSEYISFYLTSQNIDTCFCVTGGYAMFLNDAFGKNQKLRMIYNHNEQGCGYSAVGYSKVTHKPCVVHTTAGVAATNTISSVLVAWQESLPILYISGQVNNKDTIKSNPTLRHFSGQDCNICEMVKTITKYAVELQDPLKVRYELDTIFHALKTGRPGPCFLSVPIDIQNYKLKDLDALEEGICINPSYMEIDPVYYTFLENARRPLILVGNGVKQAGANEQFLKFAESHNIPVVASYNGIDVISSTHELYTGRCGINGDRVGNFAIQNCDLLITLGCRMALCVVGYNYKAFSRGSKKIMVDVDQSELDKTFVDIDLKIRMDVKQFLRSVEHVNMSIDPLWTAKTREWKMKWFNQLPPDVSDSSPYVFYKQLMGIIPNNTCIVSSSGAIHTPLVHSFNNLDKNVKFIMNSATGDMGSELPGTLGVYLSGLFDHVIGVIGDGSFMFNIQELQTIRYHSTNNKMIIMNNNGYESIRVSQKNYFGELYGTDEDSGLSFPEFSSVAKCFGFNYYLFDNDFTKLKTILEGQESWIIEVKCSSQDRHPKLSSSKDPETGVIVSKPLEDMFPFLDREEFNSNMFVKEYQG